ncbi:MAG: MazG-like family protein [Clostridiales bacterium]|nr:MazG-like family protein [Clostridiales bacterium]
MKIDIANNIKTVELLKVELLQKITDFYGDISAEPDCETMSHLTEDAASLINIAYIMSLRLGLEFDDINEMMIKQLNTEIENDHLIEKRYGDLSKLKKSLSSHEI